jgi:translation elongation factor P/translation initiation factor 5A
MNSLSHSITTTDKLTYGVGEIRLNILSFLHTDDGMLRLTDVETYLTIEGATNLIARLQESVYLLGENPNASFITHDNGAISIESPDGNRVQYESLDYYKSLNGF